MSLITGTTIELAARSTAKLSKNPGLPKSIAAEVGNIFGKAIGQNVYLFYDKVHLSTLNDRTVLGALRVDRTKVFPFALRLGPGKVELQMWKSLEAPSACYTSFDLEHDSEENRLLAFYKETLTDGEKEKSKWYDKVKPGAVAEVQEAAKALAKALRKHRLALTVYGGNSFSIVPKGLTVECDVPEEFVLDIDRFPDIELPVAGYFDTDDHVLAIPEENF